MTVHQKVDIGILLDKCGINYTEEQLEKLEELLENLGVFCKNMEMTNFSQEDVEEEKELVKDEASSETFSEVVQEISEFKYEHSGSENLKKSR